MAVRWDVREHWELALHLGRWLLLCLPVAGVTGSLVALFLWLLDWATRTRWEFPWLMGFLPLAGIGIAVVYHRLGRGSEGGNNLVMEQIHHPGGGVPRRMAPLVLVATVVTHLFGGSAGREGTAVQMGGSVASGFARRFGLDHDETRVLLMAGVAAGFGAVFGTPLAGAIFAIEVLTIGRLRHDAIIPCLMAAMMGDWVCTAWGVGHTHYHIATVLASQGEKLTAPLEPLLLGKVALAAVAFGLASVLFAQLSHRLGAAFRRTIPVYWLRPVAGAVLVLGGAWMLGTTDYLGLGVTTADGSGVSIVNAFHEGGATPWSWLWKTLLTAVTISSGFKGGEVTPLFFIGATLGNTLAVAMGAPVDLLAALGFVAVFAGATNTPLACTIMGVELFGAEYLHYFATACFVAYLVSGHHSIYTAQRVHTRKGTHQHFSSAGVPVGETKGRPRS